MSFWWLGTKSTKRAAKTTKNYAYIGKFSFSLEKCINFSTIEETDARQRNNLAVWLCLQSSVNWNLSLLAAPTREIVIIKEKPGGVFFFLGGKLKNHYVGAVCAFRFSLYYSYNLFEAIFQSHSTCGQLKKRSLPVAINHGNCQGVPPLYKYDQSKGTCVIYIHILPRFVTQLKVETKWHFNMPHEAVWFSLINIVKVSLLNLEDALEWAMWIRSGRGITLNCPMECI